ncbi:hypothetical protein CR513_24038, partial [Mucuna pruriens]
MGPGGPGGPGPGGPGWGPGAGGPGGAGWGPGPGGPGWGPGPGGPGWGPGPGGPGFFGPGAFFGGFADACTACAVVGCYEIVSVVHAAQAQGCQVLSDHGLICTL